jgi:hypothetical protein
MVGDLALNPRQPQPAVLHRENLAEKDPIRQGFSSVKSKSRRMHQNLCHDNSIRIAAKVYELIGLN